MAEGYRIHAGFGRCVRWSAKAVSGMGAALVAFIFVLHEWLHEPYPPGWAGWSQTLLDVVLVVPPAALVFAGLMFGVLRMLAPTATRHGLLGKSLAGRLCFPWPTITRVTGRSFHGVSSVLVECSASRYRIAIITLALDRNEAYARLAELAGGGHILCRHFARDRGASA